MTALTNSSLRYVVISPAKDEAGRIERTIQSMISQTIKPVRWVIVDDGSVDRTAEIVESYRQTHSWIKLIRVARGAQRKLGSAEIRAFEVGFQCLQDEAANYIVKLDCDLEFEAEYFEQLLSRFTENPRLGIASGVYLEKVSDRWMEVEMPSYHASGASKVVRAKCFSDIGGFPLFPGWDTADEIKAQARGWETRHFRDIKFYHLRKEGSATGKLSTNVLHGRVFYVTGGGPFYFAIKTAKRVVKEPPPVLAAMAMVWGYVKAWVTRTPKLVSESEAMFYREQLKKRLNRDLGNVFRLAHFSRREQGQS